MVPRSLTPPPGEANARRRPLGYHRAVILHAAPVMLGALCVLAVAYRYYSAFIAAKVLVLDDARTTPAHTLRDGHNFVPTSKWVLFGHHFAAISGSGPLIGPTLAAQFGFAPGFLWLLAGVVLAGSVHDFVILTASMRKNGRSLAELVRDELGVVPGIVAVIAILAVIVVAISGLGIVVVGALAESAWGTFTVGASIPIALLMGLYTYKLAPGPNAVRNATIAGIALLLLALVFGKHVQDTPALAEHFRFSRTTITLVIAGYGFVASVLPVWMLLCPRDYLSSYLKIGTIALLVGGVLLVNPRIEAPMFSEWIGGGGPIIKGPLFPFVFVTIACGAISGFHALVSSGTTPKMISKESDARLIGYGAMLMEGLVGLTALIAATSLPVDDYLAINTDPKVAVVAEGAAPGLFRANELPRVLAQLNGVDRAALGVGPGDTLAALRGREVPLSVALSLSNATLAAGGYHVDPAESAPITLTHDDFARLGISVTDLPRLAASSNERIAARTGGGVSLAVGMARIFAGVPFVRSLGDLVAYWYHFAIMFEALFILTTIDTGTRVGRFLVQEVLGKLAKPLGRSDSLPAGVLATLLVVGGWTAFLLTGSVQTIWPMFGIANQLLAVVALAVGTTYLLRERGGKPALLTFLPLCFLTTTTLTAGVQGIWRIYLPLAASADPKKALQGWSSTAFTAVLLVCVVFLLGAAARRWFALLRAGAPIAARTA